MALVLAKCTNCGATLQVESAMEAAVCPKCNAAFVVEKAINSYNIEHGGIITQEKQQTGDSEKKNQKSNVLIIVVVILAVIILLGGGLFAYTIISDDDSSHSYSDNSSDDSSDDPSGDPSDDPSDKFPADSDEGETGALKGMYVSESGLYKVEFNKDFTCIWYQEVHGNEVFFKGNYKLEDGVYVLHMEGEMYAYNTRFDAVLTEDGLIVTGGLVNGELFVKQ